MYIYIYIYIYTLIYVYIIYYIYPGFSIGVWPVRGTVGAHCGDFQNFSEVGLKIFCVWQVKILFKIDPSCCLKF